MIKEADILEKLNILVNAALDAGKDEIKLTALCQPLETVITTYFETDYSSGINSCVKALAHGLIRSGIVYSDGSTDADDIVKVPDMGEIAKDIYITKHYKDVIDFYEFDVVIPAGVNDEA